MPDLSLRLHKDMLVLSTPLESALARDTGLDIEMALLVEEDTLADLLRVETAAMAQCMVAPTASLLPACLLHKNMEGRLEELARTALDLAGETKPQHLLVELGPTGLPLDPSSKGSLVENRDQYVRAARVFEQLGEFDAYFLNGFADVDSLRCALMGLRKASDRPVLVSVDVDAEGTLAGGRDSLEDALAVAAEYGASAAGFQTSAGREPACKLTARASQACQLPLLVQLRVNERKPRQFDATEENPWYRPDTMIDAALHLRAAGAQFLRATGNATPAYTGALAAAVMGTDVAPSRFALGE
ncbi:MAG: methionine synthase [Coriobacteriia bacterium]|nr:methionine synthase [Coriobacteriia bacterium]